MFTDGHCLATLTDWFDDLTDLDQVDWDMVYERYWRDNLNGLSLEFRVFRSFGRRLDFDPHRRLAPICGWVRSQIARARPAAAIRLTAGPGFIRTVLPLQDARPVELDVGIVLLYQPDRVFVECRSSDADAWWSAKPIEDAGSGFPAAAATGAVRVHDKRVLVPAFVAAEPQVRQGYFLF